MPSKFESWTETELGSLVVQVLLTSESLVHRSIACNHFDATEPAEVWSIWSTANHGEVRSMPVSITLPQSINQSIKVYSDNCRRIQLSGGPPQKASACLTRQQPPPLSTARQNESLWRQSSSSISLAKMGLHLDECAAPFFESDEFLKNTSIVSGMHEGKYSFFAIVFEVTRKKLHVSLALPWCWVSSNAATEHQRAKKRSQVA